MDDSYANDWTQTDPDDGKIVLAWSYMENYPYATETTQFMEDLSEDLGCVKMVKVERADLATTQWNHGVVFVWETITGGGCWSALGQVSGYTGGSMTSISSITDVSLITCYYQIKNYPSLGLQLIGKSFQWQMIAEVELLQLYIMKYYML